MSLTVANASATSHTLDMTVEVRGSTSLPPYLNVNSDQSQTVLPNWKCNPAEVPNPGADNVFTFTG